jgi:Tfp pilus assembly protein PilF
MGGPARISSRLRKSIAMLGVLLCCGTAWMARTETARSDSGAPADQGDIFSVLDKDNPPAVQIIPGPIAGKDEVFAARPSPYVKHAGPQTASASPPQKHPAAAHKPEKKSASQKSDARFTKPVTLATRPAHTAVAAAPRAPEKSRPVIVAAPLPKADKALAARPSPYLKTASVKTNANEASRPRVASAPKTPMHVTAAARPAAAQKPVASAAKTLPKSKPVVVAAPLPKADKALAARPSPYVKAASAAATSHATQKPGVAAAPPPQAYVTAALRPAPAQKPVASAAKTLPIPKPVVVAAPLPKADKALAARPSPYKVAASAAVEKPLKTGAGHTHDPKPVKAAAQRELKMPGVAALAAARAITFPNPALPGAILQAAHSSNSAAAASLSVAAHAGEMHRALASAARDLKSAAGLSEAATLQVAALTTIQGSMVQLASSSVTDLSLLSPAAGGGTDQPSALPDSTLPPASPASPSVSPAAVMELPLPPMPANTPPAAPAPQETLPPPMPAITMQPLPASPAPATPVQLQAIPMPVPAPVTQPQATPSSTETTTARTFHPPGSPQGTTETVTTTTTTNVTPPPLLSAQSKAIVDALPPEKQKPQERRPPVQIQHTRANSLDTEDVRSHEGVGISISVHQPKLDISHMLESAYDALIAGNQEEAILLYRRVLDQQPENKLALFGLATTYHRAGQLQLARPLYGKLLAIDPNNAEGLNNFLVLLADESPQEALAEMKKLQQTHPDFSPLPAQMAVIYEKAGDVESALKSMKHAIDLSPENIKYRYDMAVMLDRAGGWEQAADYYEQLLTANDRGEKIPANPEEIQERLTFIRSNKPKAQAAHPVYAQPESGKPSQAAAVK